MEHKMKRYRQSSLFVLLLALCTVTAGASKKPQSAGTQTFKGELMDTLCASYKGHEHMMQELKSMGTDKKSCIRQCLLLGAKYALYDATQQTTYRIDDQDKDKVEPFLGRQVRITGTLDKKTIKVADIKPGE
jgi:hypothetical protein